MPLSAITWEAVAQTAFTPAAEDPKTPSWLDNRLHQRVRAARLAANERLTPFEDFASYCNFYEFGTGKDEPARNALGFTVHPWSVRIDGEVERPGAYGLEDLLRGVTLEDRIYRLRCVEAWSMVVPWVGFPLSAVLRRVAPNSRGKYVVFETLHDPRRMPGQREPWLHWPYVEGLRIDEAMHPLTILAVGAYGRSLLPQNGAPLRLVVPWKYGFKSIKSIVRIGLVERPPRTTWSDMAPDEYGFLANVNPAVDHPRWSQRRERRLPTSFFAPNWIETQPFNGYGEQVAGLYRGIDLRRHF